MCNDAATLPIICYQNHLMHLTRVLFVLREIQGVLFLTFLNFRLPRLCYQPHRSAKKLKMNPIHINDKKLSSRISFRKLSKSWLHQKQLLKHTHILTRLLSRLQFEFGDGVKYNNRKVHIIGEHKLNKQSSNLRLSRFAGM